MEQEKADMAYLCMDHALVLQQDYKPAEETVWEEEEDDGEMEDEENEEDQEVWAIFSEEDRVDVDVEKLKREYDYLINADAWALRSAPHDIPGGSQGPKRRKRDGPGRPPLTDIYPEILPTLEQFVKQHGAAAHEKRHETTTFSHGVSLKVGLYLKLI